MDTNAIIQGFREKLYMNLPNRFEPLRQEPISPVSRAELLEREKSAIETELEKLKNERQFLLRNIKLAKTKLDNLLSKKKISEKIKKEREGYELLRKENRKRLAEELFEARKRLRVIKGKCGSMEHIQERLAKEIKKEISASWADKLMKARNYNKNLIAYKNSILVEIGELKNQVKGQAQRIYEEVEHLIKVERYSSGEIEEMPFAKVPPPSIRPSVTGDGLPMLSGIYFIWEGEKVEYVGQSVNIKNRATLSHGKISINDRISFLPYPKNQLLYAECFYIGILRPGRNSSTPSKSA